MKKIYALLFTVTTSVIGYSQSIVLFDQNKNIISNTVVDIYISTNSVNTEEVLVSNEGLSSKTIKVARNILSMDVNDSTQFCWGGLCYSANTNVSNHSLVINVHDTMDFNLNGFHGIFYSGAATVTRKVHYKFYDINNVTDSTGITLRYIDATGIDESEKINGFVSAPFPNPTVTVSFVNYKLNGFVKNGKLIFYNLLGKEIKQIPLTAKEGTEKINVSEFNYGVYFYSLVADGIVLSTKKLIVNPK